MTFSQDNRVLINGQIIVPVGDDAGGIEIYNATSQRGTISLNDGSFIIAGRKGDILLFRGVQYEKFDVALNERVINNKKITVYLYDDVNELPEVVVRKYDLTGDISVDAQRIETTPIEAPVTGNTFDVVYSMETDFLPDDQTSPEILSMDTQEQAASIRFLNIFNALVKDRYNPNKKYVDLSTDLRRIIDDDFFKNYLNIEEEKIPEFIIFLEDNGLTKRMMNKGKSLKLVDFLIKQSKVFKKSMD
ncbi:hypothetical protein GCM10009117_23550 [Gangjinia marincola]|uniref:Uncharacterized protein n=1 Tax=Gangjinia marincola TaxID=578463 RepID=A0ABN1MJ16_9FLAO